MENATIALRIVQSKRLELSRIAVRSGVVSKRAWEGLITLCRNSGLNHNEKSLIARYEKYKKTCRAIE